MTGKTRDLFLALCIRNIWLVMAHSDIDLQIRHIPGVRNIIADTLSHIYSDKPVNSETLQDLLNNYYWKTVPRAHYDFSLHI